MIFVTLSEKYSDLASLEEDLNKALQSRLPTGIRQGQQKIAIDFNLIPYYGEPSPEEAPYIYRSQAKNGTCSFYAYATIYVIKKNKRVTVFYQSCPATKHFGGNYHLSFSNN
jgi:putative transposase